MRSNIRQMRRRRRRLRKLRKFKRRLADTQDPTTRRRLIEKIWGISFHPPKDLPDQ